MRRHCLNNDSECARRACCTNPAPVAGLRLRRAFPRLWRTMWKSQECPLRAGFRWRRRRSGSVRRASIRSPRPVRTAPTSRPSCAVDERSYARRRFLHTRPALDRGRRPHPRRPLADGVRRVVLHHESARAGGRRARGRRAERVHARLDRGPLRRARATRGDRRRPRRLGALPRGRREPGEPSPERRGRQATTPGRQGQAGRHNEPLRSSTHSARSGDRRLEPLRACATAGRQTEGAEARPTTNSSSTATRASARRICCRPSRTTSSCTHRACAPAT